MGVLTGWNCPEVMVPFTQHLQITQPDLDAIVADLACFLVGLHQSAFEDPDHYRTAISNLLRLMSTMAEDGDPDEQAVN